MGAVPTSGSAAHPTTRTLPGPLTATPSMLPIGLCRQPRSWPRVPLSVAGDVEHLGSNTQGGVHVMTRHMIAVTFGMSWWHCPYRDTVQHDFRLPQSPCAQPHPHGLCPGTTLQSM